MVIGQMASKIREADARSRAQEAGVAKLAANSSFVKRVTTIDDAFGSRAAEIRATVEELRAKFGMAPLPPQQR